MNGVIQFRDSFPLEDVQVELSTQSETEFQIQSTKRSFALIAESPEERQQWVDALQNAINENEEKRESFDAAKRQIAMNALPMDDDRRSIQSNDSQSAIVRRDSSLVHALGDRAPVWINDQCVTMCQICASEFTMINRRHHCRACGMVVCRSCSDRKYALKYNNNTLERVCNNCYQILTNQQQGVGTPLPTDDTFIESFESSLELDQANNFSRNPLRTSSRNGKKNIPNIYLVSFFLLSILIN